MPRFFFDIHDGDTCVDEQGLVFPDLDAAIGEAVRGLPQLAAHKIPGGDDHRHFTVVVRDEDGRPLYTAALTYVGLRLANPKTDRVCEPEELAAVGLLEPERSS